MVEATIWRYWLGFWGCWLLPMGVHLNNVGQGCNGSGGLSRKHAVAFSQGAL
ncbi:ADP-ribosylation factor GTPase-activating protein AGD3-like [Pyrus ussuriensis x Pyrus communis]|uniref:ADP-ribosylation factor GTPase-activating protein AGD3-like n=1 Tax=Pyrus ussuriensis x Pyrus communis TaxID=2448454 RepID=A0A5N5HAH6_9ROSA|nr:ADP-ribosylation factor GTPase-activating protein AGD3-like [Pyrus ussuriensis x Pyrus communis]